MGELEWALGLTQPVSSARQRHPPLRPAVATVPVKSATATLLQSATRHRHSLQAAFVAHALDPKQRRNGSRSGAGIRGLATSTGAWAVVGLKAERGPILWTA